MQSVTYKFKHIMYQYQRGFLWVDLLCIMPWEWFQDAMLSGAPWLRSISLPRLLKLFRMTRLLKIVRAQRSYRTFEGFSRYFPMWLVRSPDCGNAFDTHSSIDTFRLCKLTRGFVRHRWSSSSSASTRASSCTTCRAASTTSPPSSTET